MPSAPILDLTTVSHPYPNTKVICIIFYTVFHMESFQYLHDNGYMQFNQGRMCFPLTTKIHYTHPNHVLQSLYGPFRLTISLRMKSYTKIQSSTQSLIPPLVNQFMQLLYYRSPFCADVYKTAADLYLRHRQLPSLYQDGKEIEYSKSFNIFIRLHWC